MAGAARVEVQTTVRRILMMGGASAVHAEFASPVHAHRFTRLCTRSSAVHEACSAVHAACSAE